MPQRKPAWNKNRSVGPRLPLIPHEILAITDLLIRAGEWRDLCLFVVATETMLRSVDILRLRVLDVADLTGQVFERFSVRQQKTREPVTVSLSPYAQGVCRHWMSVAQKAPGDYLFTRLRGDVQAVICSFHYRSLVKRWVSLIGLDPTHYSTHSLRRTRAVLIFRKFKDPEIVRILLGHASIASTSAYLGLDTQKALDAAREVPLFPDSLNLEGEGSRSGFSQLKPK